MTDKRQRFSTSEIVESLKETGSRVRSVASEFSENAAENYRARGHSGDRQECRPANRA